MPLSSIDPGFKQDGSGDNQIALVSGDGTGNLATIKSASSTALATDPSLVITFSPNSPLPAGSATIGAVTQASGPWTQNLTQVGGSAIALGQTTMSASFPVTIASNQTTLNTTDLADGPVSPGTVASKSILIGGQYNSTQPTLTNTQQSAIQIDSNGRLISAPLNQVISGTIAGSGQNITSGPASGSIFINVTGTWSGTLEVIGGIGLSGTGLFISQINGASPLPYAYASITTNGDYKVIVPSALSYLEVTAVSWTSGSATVTITIGNSSSIVEVNQLNQANLLATVYQGGTWVVTAANPSVTNTGNPPPSEATYVGGSVTTSSPTYTTGTFEGFSLTTAGALRVDGSATTQPISGTVTANQGTANATPWNQNVSQFGGSSVVTGTGASGAGIPRVTVSNDSNILATQSGTWNINNISGTISLPTGAATSANQLTEITSLQLIDNPVGSVGAGTAGISSFLAGLIFNTSLPTLSSGQQAAIQGDSSARLIISPLTNSSIVKSQLQDNSGNGIASTTINSKQRLDVDLASEAQTGTTIPFDTLQVGGKNPSGNLQQLSIDRSGYLNVDINTDKSVFGPLITLSRVQQIDVDFSESIANNNISQTVTGTGSVSLSNANCTIATGTGTTSSATVQTVGNISYTPGRELYAQYTMAFTTPTSASSGQLGGLWDFTNGIYLGYNGLNFSIVSMSNGTPTYVSQSSFNLDTLTGGANSTFTRGGVPEAVNFAFKNVWRIRAGWLGAAPIYFEILSPDGNWVTFHMIRQPNTSINPAFLNPSLPITMYVYKTSSDSTNLQIVTTSWDAGIVDVSNGSDTSDSDIITSLNDYVEISTESRATVIADVTGTWSGTIQIQGDTGNGTWSPIYGTNTNLVSFQTFAANQTVIIPCAGYQGVRFQATAWTSGTANINWVASQGLQVVLAETVGNIASGQPDVGNPIKVGGVYNSTLPVVASGDRVDLQLDANGRLLTSSVSLPTTASKFSFGQLATTTSTSFLPIEFTTYTETTTNSTMTLVSSSANDTAAGTGARSVSVTYLDQNMTGPNTVTVNLNGTTAVPVTGSMCYVEKMVVATVGSTGSNVGIITLKTGGGATVGTIAATNNQTLWAHHYVPQGKTCYISGFSFGNNSTTAANGAQFVIKSATPTVANTPELQVSDFVAIAGASNTDTRTYLSPIQIAGPARVRAYTQPFANAATTQFASFDFIDN